MAGAVSALDLRFDWPRLRLPIFFTAAWADVVQEFGVRGKFSVLPVPAGIGRIDRPLPDVRPADQEEFLRIIRERVSPQMDICIEFLTHFLAWDLKRERPGDYTGRVVPPDRVDVPGRDPERGPGGLRPADGLVLPARRHPLTGSPAPH